LGALCRRVGAAVELVLVQRDQGRDVRPAVTDDQRVRDERISLQQLLDVLRRDLLAAGGGDQILLPVRDPEEAVAVELADVARPEPAVAAERLTGRFVVPVVAGEDVLAVEEDLAVAGDANLAARKREADRAEPKVVEVV